MLAYVRATTLEDELSRRGKILLIRKRLQHLGARRAVHERLLSQRRRLVAAALHRSLPIRLTGNMQDQGHASLHLTSGIPRRWQSMETPSGRLAPEAARVHAARPVAQGLHCCCIGPEDNRQGGYLRPDEALSLPPR